MLLEPASPRRNTPSFKELYVTDVVPVITGVLESDPSPT
jgi:hypothetical protein